MKIALLLGVALLAQEKSEWPTYHGGYDLTGVANTTLPDAPRRLWKFNAGNPVEHTPVIGAGRIYFTTRHGSLFALDRKGKPVWTIQIKPNDFSATPLYADQLVIVGTQKGLLCAFHANSGRMKWTYDVEDNIMGGANRIDIPEGRKGIIITAQATGAIHCVDLETGRRVWKMADVDRCDGSSSVGQGTIVMGSCASALHVFSVEKAKKVWDIPLGAESQVAGGVALSGNLAFAGTRSGSMCAVDVTTGSIFWINRDNQREAFTTPAVNAEVALFGSNDGNVTALDRTTGRTIWKFNTESPPDSPVIADRRVVVSSGGALFLLDLKDGKKIWTAKVSDKITSPAVADGRIIVGSDDGTVTAYGKD